MKRTRVVILLLCLTLLVTVLSLNCSKKKIKVAISTSVRSGSIVGSSEINSFELYLKNHPESPIEMVIINDEWEPQKARELILKAKNSGLQFFITSHPSSASVNLLNLFEDGQAFALVTASTTDKISRRDDFTYRVISDLVDEQKNMASYLAKLPGSRILIIQDNSNPAFSIPALKVFKEALGQYSPKKTLITYQTRIADFDRKILNQALNERYDILYFMAGSYQAVVGNIAQLFYHKNPRLPILILPWLRTPALIDTAGPALSQITLASQYPPKHEDPAIMKFYTDFKKHFNYEPISMSIGVYQSLEILGQAFQNGCTNPREVKNFLKKQELIHTSLGSIRFDAYGDRKTDYYFIRDLKRELE